MSFFSRQKRSPLSQLLNAKVEEDFTPAPAESSFEAVEATPTESVTFDSPEAKRERDSFLEFPKAPPVEEKIVAPPTSSSSSFGRQLTSDDIFKPHQATKPAPRPMSTPSPVAEVPRTAQQPVESHRHLATPHQESTTKIGEGLCIRGEITGTSNVVIMGTFEGNIDLKGHVSIGEKGNVLGNIRAESVSIAGKIKGNILGHERVEFQQTASAQGEVVTAKLRMSDGASFKGSVSMNIEEGAKKFEAYFPKPVVPAAAAPVAPPKAAPAAPVQTQVSLKAELPAASPTPAPVTAPEAQVRVTIPSPKNLLIRKPDETPLPSAPATSEPVVAEKVEEAPVVVKPTSAGDDLILMS